MKKRFLFLSISMLLVLSLQAQFYVGARAGYGAPIVNDDMGSPLDIIGVSDYTQTGTGSNTKISDKAIFSTSGGGIQTGIELGYWFSEHFSLNLTFLYAASTSKILDARIDRPNYKAEQTSSNKGTVALLSTMFSTGNSKVLSFYGKTSLVIPTSGAIKSEISIDDNEGVLAGKLLGTGPIPGITTQLNGTVKTTMKPAYGFSTGIGVKYAITEHLSLFSDINVTMLTVKPKESVFESYTISSNIPGADLTTYDKHIIYEDEITETSNNRHTNPSWKSENPSNERSFKQNFNQFTLFLGVNYKF